MNLKRLRWLWMFCAAAWLGVAWPQSPAFGQERFDPSEPTFLIEPGRAGPFYVGITPDELYRVVDRDRVELVDRYSEVRFQPVLQVTLPGSEDPGLVASLDMLECDRFREWWLPRLVVRDPRFRTADGMGVGSTFRELRDRGWVTADGRPGERALHPRAPNFSMITFAFWDWECEGCGIPSDADQVLSVALLQPLTELRPSRCNDLRRGP